MIVSSLIDSILKFSTNSLISLISSEFVSTNVTISVILFCILTISVCIVGIELLIISSTLSSSTVILLVMLSIVIVWFDIVFSLLVTLIVNAVIVSELSSILL